MNETIYIEKLKTLRNNQDLSKGFLKGGIVAFVLAIVWFVILDENLAISRPYAVEELLSLFLGLAVLFSIALFLLALFYFLRYRFLLRNYGTDINQWMDELGEEGMMEVFAGRSKHIGVLLLSFLLSAGILGFGTFQIITTSQQLKEAALAARKDLDDLFPDAEIVVDKWEDEYEITVNEITPELYKSYDFEYILGTDYLDPYNQSYYASFYLSDFSAEDIRADLESHIEKISQLYYPPGTDMSIFQQLLNEEFTKALQAAAAEPTDENSQEFQYDFDVDGKEVTIYLNVDVYNADNPEYHNITTSFYSYCWDY